MSMTDYQRRWQEFHGHGGQGQTGQPRKTWGPPSDVNMNVQLSPRGTLDTDAIIRKVQKEKAREEYIAEWKKFHQNTQQATPRAPPANMTGEQKLDTDRIIRNVTKENRNESEPRRKRADAGSGLNFLGKQEQQHYEAPNPILGRDGYRQEWKERQLQQQRLNLGVVDSDPPCRPEVLPTAADESRANINNTIAQARMDAHEYRQKWAEFNTGQRVNNSSLKDQTDDFKAGSLPGNESDNVKWQQRKKRNEEYNEFLASKNTQARFDDKKRGLRENVNSLPRLNYSGSAQKRQKEEERNREYNEMIQQKGQRRRGGPPADVRTGWGTPDYGDILAKQRAKEQNFRRANDIAYEADPVVRQTDAISRALDRDYEATKKAYTRERIYNTQGLLDDPDWLKPWQNPRHPYYHRWNPRYYDYWSNPNGPPSVRRTKDQGGEYFASLPLGRNTDSAQQREKNRYGNELKIQMAEAQHARQIERKEGLQVNSNSVAAPVVTRPLVRAGPKVDPYYNYLKNIPDYDQLRSNAILGDRQPTSERLKSKGGLNSTLTPRDPACDGGILDNGLFNQQRTISLEPPAGLVYQPS